MYFHQPIKQRSKHYKVYDSRGPLADKLHTNEQPDSVEILKYKGRRKIDAFQKRGSSHCIVTFLEPRTGYVMIGKIPDKPTASLQKKTISLINKR